MTKAQPKTARVLVSLTEVEFEEILQISAKTNHHYGQIVRDAYQFARHLHERVHDDPANYTGMGQEARQNMKEALDYIFGAPGVVVK